MRDDARVRAEGRRFRRFCWLWTVGVHGERAATRFTRWSTPRDVGVRTAGDGPAIRHLEAVRAAGMRGAGEVVRCVRVARVVRWRISRLEPCSPVLGGARLPHHLPATRAPCPHRPSPARVGPRRGVVGDGLDTAFPHASEDPAAAPPAPRRTKSRFRRETGISARVRRRRRPARAGMPASRKNARLDGLRDPSGRDGAVGASAVQVGDAVDRRAHQARRYLVVISP